MTIHDEIFQNSSQAVLEHQHGQNVVLAIEGKEPLVCVAIVSAERRSQRHETTGVRIVRERKATVTSGLEIEEFESLLQAKLSATMTVNGLKYPVDDVSLDGSSVVFTLVREGRQELSRPGYRGYGR